MRGVKTIRLCLCLSLPSICCDWQGLGTDSEKPAFFEDQVQAILENRCRECHNPDTRKANLDLSTTAGLIRGSDSGPVFKAGDLEHSLIYEMVHTKEMPRKGGPLSHDEVAIIGDWIKNGARFETPPDKIAASLHQHDVIPILLLRCATCHGPRLQQGGLDMQTKEAALKGGDSGPAIVPGDPDASLAIQRIESQACPPKGQLLKYFVKRPPAEEIARLRDWIAAGAPEENIEPDVATTDPDSLVTDEDRQHWSFRPLPKKVGVPRFEEREFPVPVDAFIYHRLKEQGLGFSPEAGRLTLIRRAFFDLTGLPPSVEELNRWSSHSSSGWYEELIEHLLNSPAYGERWGRYWLDVAGYADSEGGQAADTIREVAWKYRDYVIRAFNDDTPYDRFLLEQIAGDELADHEDPDAVTDEIVDNLVATGFLRMGIDQTGSRTMNFVPERIGLIADAIDVLGSGVMGLTMDCARCHGHKYDPIPQRDYYRLKAIFQGAFDEHDWMSWKTRKLEVATPGSLQQVQAHNPPLEKEIKTLESQRKKAVATPQNRYYEERWPKVSKAEQEEIQAALKANATRRTIRQVELVQHYHSYLKPDEPHLVEMHPELGEQLANLDAEIDRLNKRLLPPVAIRALWDRGDPSPTYILRRGEHNRPGRLVGPGVPSALTNGRTPLEVEPPWPGAQKTGRRLAFARWLTGPDHPLTARVFVNRVWKHHFGEGLVRTLDNFGIQGEPPSHPKLLDWLARDFVDRGWSLKTLHRTLMLSQTYRQSSARTPERDRIDPQNRLLSRMTMRRLNAEALRDSILFVSGRLNEAMFGPPEEIAVRDDGLIMEKDDAEGRYRRSLYLQLRRTEMPSLMATFDYPQMEPNCIDRTTSTVSLQALMLFNNARIYELARAFADRIRESSRDPEAQIETAYQLAFSRPPTDAEITDGVKTLANLEDQWRRKSESSAAENAFGTFCHTLLNSAEFLYVD